MQKPNPNQKQNAVVIITGASSGIGLAIAKEYAKRNTNLVLAARSLEALDEIAGKLSNSNNNIITVKADVSKENDCKQIVEKTIEAFGRIDVLINNAGISMRACFVETDIKVIHRVMDVNFWGTVYCTKYAMPYLLKSGGSVVGVSSIAGYKGLPGRTGYSASKFAMHGFLEALRIENLKKGVHVMVACPGFTESNIRNVALSKDGSQQGESPRDENKMMGADEVARRIVRGIDKRKRSLIMSREGKLTVLLSRFFPKMTDNMVYKHLAKEPDAPFV